MENELKVYLENRKRELETQELEAYRIGRRDLVQEIMVRQEEVARIYAFVPMVTRREREKPQSIRPNTGTPTYPDTWTSSSSI